MEPQSQPDPTSVQSQTTYKFFPTWLKSTKYNLYLENVDIFPFKCPFNPHLNSHLPPDQQLYWKDIYEFSQAMDKPITDVIDLTDTDQFYSSECLDPYKIKHHKFLMDRKKTPDEKTIKEIINKIDEIIKGGGVVGIHCLHGRNRTGYIVCQYLVRKLSWEPKTALDTFNKARGEKISKKESIKTILTLSKGC